MSWPAEISLEPPMASARTAAPSAPHTAAPWCRRTGARPAGAVPGRPVGRLTRPPPPDGPAGGEKGITGQIQGQGDGPGRASPAGSRACRIPPPPWGGWTRPPPQGPPASRPAAARPGGRAGPSHAERGRRSAAGPAPRPNGEQLPCVEALRPVKDGGGGGVIAGVDARARMLIPPPTPGPSPGPPGLAGPPRARRSPGSR